MNDSHKNRVGLLLTFLFALSPLAGCGVPSADGPANTYYLDFSLPPGAATRGAMVFAVDGVNAEIFADMLAKGELPAIRKYFVDRGLYAPQAVANVPAVTLPNLTSMVTGCFPGHHGIVGVNWFDRNLLLWRDYATIAQKDTLDGDYLVPNLYEQFPQNTTVSVFFQPHRNATKFVEDWTTGGPCFFFHWYEFLDRLTLSRMDLVMDIARARKEFPAVTILYQLSPDFAAYEHGASSSQYRQSLRHADRQIGRVLADVERAGLLDKIVIALVSDHGHDDVLHHHHMGTYLADVVGLKLSRDHLWENTPFERRLAAYEPYSAVLYGSGDRYSALSLRKPIRDGAKFAGWEPWNRRPSADDFVRYPVEKRNGQPSREVDLLKSLTDLPAVDAVAWSVGAEAVRVRTKAGEVEFRQHPQANSRLEGATQSAKSDGCVPQRPPISYRVISGDDPLGYRGHVKDNVLSGAVPLSPLAWLEQTHDTQYPDLPPQVLAYFQTRRAGDLLAFAAPGWDFNSSHKSGHGGVRPIDLFVPMLIAGPGVPHATVPRARTVDLAPTLLHLLSKPIPPTMDGRSLIENRD